MEKTILTVTLPVWGIKGYTPITTVWEEISIAEKYDKEAIIKTVEGETEDCKDDYRKITELAMVLNWKVWTHAGKNNELSKLYEELYEKTDKKAMETLEGKELEYYYEKTA